LQLLFLSQGFSNGALAPLRDHGAVLWGPHAAAEQGPRAEAEVKTRFFIDEQGATSVENLLKGITFHESLRTTVLSDTDKPC